MPNQYLTNNYMIILYLTKPCTNAELILAYFSIQINVYQY